MTHDALDEQSVIWVFLQDLGQQVQNELDLFAFYLV